MIQQPVTALKLGDPDDGDYGRQQRGLMIAATANITKDPWGYRVPAQSRSGSYLVNFDHGPYCDCPDFEERQKPCKHIYATEVFLRREEYSGDVDDAEMKPVGVRTTQPWQAYNTSQVYEGELFETLLWELCNTVPQPPQTNGRPRFPLSDMLYGMGLKVYSTLSTRRAMSGIRNAVSAGRMCKEPSFSTPIRYFERPEVTPVLRQLIQQSALPLRDLEVDFAQDSSGFASTAYNRWFDHKWGTAKKEVRWTKLHIMVGVQSNIVTVADATPSQSADSPYLPGFVRATAEHFHIREVSADAAYSSRQNLHAVVDAGGVPYIDFKKVAKARAKGSKPDELWAQMYHMFTLNTAEFKRHYHKRSNVETTFHMIKSKFSDKVRAKTDTAQVNEVLMKVLCHNVCVLIRAMHVLGITPVLDHGGVQETFASETAPDAQPLAI
jgi:transposase